MVTERLAAGSAGAARPAWSGRLEPLAALYHLIEAVGEARALPDIYEAALDGLVRGLGVDRASILLFDRDDVMRFKAWRGLSEGYRGAVEGHSPWGRDERDPQPILIPDAERDQALEDVRSTILGEGIRALAFIPLVYQGRLLGKFMLYLDRPHDWSEEEVRLGLALASHIAFAIGRQVATDEAAARARQQAAVAELGQRALAVTPAEHGFDALLADAARTVAGTLGVEFAAVLELAPDGETAVLRAGVGWPGDQVGRLRVPATGNASQAAYALAAREPVLAPDLAAETRFVSPPEIAARGIVSGLSVVLHGSARPFGVLSAHALRRRAFSADDVHFVRAVANVLTAAIEREHAEAERARLLESERAARAQLEAASRAKDEFLATVSHELRTPLTAMLAWPEVLRAGSLDPAAVAHGLDVMERNARLQAQIIDDLLEVSRIITGKLRLEARPAELAPLVGAAVESVRGATEAKGIALAAALAEGVRAAVDPARLQQVLWNLLTNAIKFTPAKGRIDVGLERDGDHAVIRVADSGSGIRPEFLPHVFERFRQADSSTTRRHGGLGLGLAIVRHLVELHGGSVEAESEGEGRGAVFTIRLPMSTAADGAEPSTASHATGDSRRPLAGLKLVIVDDEPDTLEMLGVLLEQYGAEVRAAGSAPDALAEVRSFRPDVLVSDIGMPGEDGYSLIGKVRALPPESGGATPAVALTAYARDEDRERALAAGYQVHVAKPIEPARLAGILAGLAREGA